MRLESGIASMRKRICTEYEYFKMGFAIKRARTEISRLRYHNPEVVQMMKDGLKDIRRTINCETPEFERISSLCKSESRLRDRYAKMVLREIRRVRDTMCVIPEIKSRNKAYWIFDVIVMARIYATIKHYLVSDYKYLFTEQAERAIIRSEEQPRGYEHETI